MATTTRDEFRMYVNGRPFEGLVSSTSEGSVLAAVAYLRGKHFAVSVERRRVTTTIALGDWEPVAVVGK